MTFLNLKIGETYVLENRQTGKSQNVTVSDVSKVHATLLLPDNNAIQLTERSVVMRTTSKAGPKLVLN